MADRSGTQFSIFQDIYVRFDIRIDMSMSIRPVITKFGKQVHLQDLTQMRIIKKILVTPLRQDHVKNWKHISTIRVSMVAKLGWMVNLPL